MEQKSNDNWDSILGDGVLVKIQDDGLLLVGGMTLAVHTDDAGEDRYEITVLRLQNYELDPSSKMILFRGEKISGNYSLMVTNGTPSQLGEESYLITGSDDLPVKVQLFEASNAEPSGRVRVEFWAGEISERTESGDDEESGAAQSENEQESVESQTQDDQTEGTQLEGTYLEDGETQQGEQSDTTQLFPENVEVQTESHNRIETALDNGILSISNPINLHATDQEKKEWHVEEHAGNLKIQSPGQESLLAAVSVTADEELVIEGGVCSKPDDTTILIQGNGKDNPLRIEAVSREGAHLQHEGLCVVYKGTLGSVQQERSGLLWLLGGALILSILAAALVSGLLIKNRKAKSKQAVLDNGGGSRKQSASNAALSMSFGQCQNIGKRSSQQDSKGLFGLNNSLLAVVADGMGGLKNGDRVSRKIVQTIGEDCKSLGTEKIKGNLMAMVAHANDEVSRMLGPDEVYKSGSTLVAVLAEPYQFQWISVGDSRVYLYRAGRLLQLNREHNFEADLLLRAVNHQISFQEVRSNPKRKSVSSFIGMGNLKYVDEAQRPIRSLKGDRILICSDGVFNTISEQKIEAILGAYPEPGVAAEKLEAAVLQANNPHQDNFTAIIVSYE